MLDKVNKTDKDVNCAYMEEAIRKNTDLYPKAYEAVSEWRSLYFSKERPVLLMTENIFGLSIYDTRPCSSEKNRIILTYPELSVKY